MGMISDSVERYYRFTEKVLFYAVDEIAHELWERHPENGKWADQPQDRQHAMRQGILSTLCEMVRSHFPQADDDRNPPITEANFGPAMLDIVDKQHS